MPQVISVSVTHPLSRCWPDCATWHRWTMGTFDQFKWIISGSKKVKFDDDITDLKYEYHWFVFIDIISKKLLISWKRIEFLRYTSQGMNESHSHASNKMWPLLHRYGKEFNLAMHGYNTGVIGFNLQKWRANNVSDELLYWMQLHKKMNLWHLGIQPIMYVLVGNDVQLVDSRWNLEAHLYGSRRLKPKEPMSSAFILHWNGSSELQKLSARVE